MRFHADDLGAAPSVTEAIIECHKAGAINSTSVLINGQSLDELKRALDDHPELDLTLHLNLSDGVALRSDHRLLTVEDGNFRHTFGSLSWLYLTSSIAVRAQLKSEILSEFRAQCGLFQTLLLELGRSPELALDTHEHFHFLPFVFDVIEELSREYTVKRIRLPRRVIYLSHYGWSPIGIVKGALLTLLGRYLAERVPKDWERPVLLLTGQINPNLLSDTFRHHPGEAIFHPRRTTRAEATRWERQPHLRKAYLAEHRDSEYEDLIRFGCSL